MRDRGGRVFRGRVGVLMGRGRVFQIKDECISLYYTLLFHQATEST